MKTENNLDTDQIKGLVWRLAIPSMLAQFVSVFYSIVDRMYIGNIAGIGEIALAGVGGSPLMSIRMGEKNHRAASQILANCFFTFNDFISSNHRSFLYGKGEAFDVVWGQ